MKKIIFILIVIINYFNTNAQTNAFYVFGNYNFYGNHNIGWFELEKDRFDFKHDLGYSAGFGFRFKIAYNESLDFNYAISIEPQYNFNEFSETVDYPHPSFSSRTLKRFHKISEIKIPLMISIVNNRYKKHPALFRGLSMGVYGSRVLKVNYGDTETSIRGNFGTEINTNESDRTDDYMKNDFGLTASIELKLFFSRLRLNYFHSLTTKRDKSAGLGYIFNSSYLSAGLLFNL